MEQINDIYEMLACRYTQNQDTRDRLSGIPSGDIISRLLGFTFSFHKIQKFNFMYRDNF